MKVHIGYRQDVGMTIHHMIINKYPEWTSYSLTNSEKKYIGLLSETFPPRNRINMKLRPSIYFANLWEGKGDADQCINHEGEARFKGESPNTTLQHRFAMKFKCVRKAFVTRVLKTVQAFVSCKCKLPGLDIYDEHSKLNALMKVLESGLDRRCENFEILKPLFQSFSLPKERKALLENSVSCNLTKVSLTEFKLVNGVLFNDLLEPTDVARILLVVENYIGKASNWHCVCVFLI